ncbi:MAG: MFS transporter, partial [Bacteroidia bacterium]
PNNPILQKFLEKKEIIVNESGYFDKIIELKMWPSIWLCFASYALVVAVLFALLFKHKHDPQEIGEINH